jgi:hypothetical protein
VNGLLRKIFTRQGSRHFIRNIIVFKLFFGKLVFEKIFAKCLYLNLINPEILPLKIFKDIHF